MAESGRYGLGSATSKDRKHIKLVHELIFHICFDILRSENQTSTVASHSPRLNGYSPRFVVGDSGTEGFGGDAGP